MTAQLYATFNNISLSKFAGNPIYGLARASQIEFNDFLGPRLFSVTFKVMKMKKVPGLSKTRENPGKTTAT